MRHVAMDDRLFRSGNVGLTHSLMKHLVRSGKNLITEIHATKATAACNISEGVSVESSLFARQLRMIMVKTHKHFIFRALVVYLTQKDS